AIPEACRYGTKSFAIDTQWSIDGQRLTHHLRCGVKPIPQVLEESLRGDGLGDYLFDTHAKTLGASGGLQDGGAINVALKGTGGGRNPTQRHSASSSLLGQVAPQTRVS